MIVCVQCRREMNCLKNGVGVDWGDGHVYPGDRFGCPGCGAEIIRTGPGSTYDPLYNKQHEYLTMRQHGETKPPNPTTP